MIITYKVSPLLGIKLNWVTEITHVKDKQYFVDEQRIGPYAMWHHEHKIEPIEGGVLMTDIITYQPPMGFLGVIANSLFIKKQLQDIFDYRIMALEKSSENLFKPQRVSHAPKVFLFAWTRTEAVKPLKAYCTITILLQLSCISFN